MGGPEAQPREEMVVKRKGTAFSAVVGEKKMSRKKSRGRPLVVGRGRALSSSQGVGGRTKSADLSRVKPPRGLSGHVVLETRPFPGYSAGNNGRGSIAATSVETTDVGPRV